jgi:hypothetical protein
MNIENIDVAYKNYCYLKNLTDFAENIDISKASNCRIRYEKPNRQTVSVNIPNDEIKSLVRQKIETVKGELKSLGVTFNDGNVRRHIDKEV